MKSEKEKMLGGEIYDCGDDALLRRWHEAKRLQAEYNATASDDAVGQASRVAWRGCVDRRAILCRLWREYTSGPQCGDKYELRISRLQQDYDRGLQRHRPRCTYIYRIPSDRPRRTPLARRPFLEVANGARDHRPQRMDRRRCCRPARCNHR